MSNICLLNYNNYFNRIHKKAGNYIANYDGIISTIEGVRTNFHGDGVNTTFEARFDTSFEPDYLIEYEDRDFLSEEGGYTNIVSRWFIIDIHVLNTGMATLTLKRDVLSDFEWSVENSDAYIEKGNVPSGDIAIYNQENIIYNSIKNKQESIKDKTKVPWIVGYFADDTQDKNITVNPRALTNTITLSSLSEWDYYDYCNLGSGNKLFTNIGGQINIIVNQTGIVLGDCYEFYFTRYGSGGYKKITSVLSYNGSVNSEKLNNFNSYLRSNSENLFKKVIEETSSLNDDFIDSFDGKYIFAEDTGKTYKIKTVRTEKVEKNYSVGDGFTEVFENNFNEYIHNNFSYYSYFVDKRHNITANIKGTEISFILSEINIPSTLNLQISSNSRKLVDAPYRMFCIPYSNLNVVGNNIDFTTLDFPSTVSIATKIATSLGSSVFDIQLLPYFPEQNYILEENTISLYGKTEGIDYSLIKDGDNENVGIVIFPSYSSFSLKINKNDVEGIEEITEINEDVIELKTKNQCDKIRLCSPNHASFFDFNSVKNGGLEFFNVECTYKPFNPYIKINPNFSGLYGKDYNDARGLICQGDFSLPIINDNWVQYQINNKNYLNIFNRSISTIEFDNKVAGFRETAGTVLSGIGASKFGGVGAGITAIGTGIVNASISESMREEHLKSSIGNFYDNLQNIQAQPQTIAKVSSFDIDNNIFPFYEYYTCSDQEKEDFKNRLIFEGMTIGRIGKIKDYNSYEDYNLRFLKANILRIRLGVKSDSHLVNDIKNELSAGIYWYGSDEVENITYENFE